MGSGKSTEDCQLLPAILVEMKGPLLLLFFSLFLILWAVTDSKCCSQAVDLTDTHTKRKTLSQLHLERGTGHRRSLPTLLFQKGSCLSTQFRRVPMSPVR